MRQSNILEASEQQQVRPNDDCFLVAPLHGRSFFIGFNIRITNGYASAVSGTDGSQVVSTTKRRPFGNRRYPHRPSLSCVFTIHPIADGDSDWPLSPYSYEEVTRSALLMRYPELIAPGRWTSEMIEFIDILPTILELRRIKTPSNIQVRSLTHIIKGEAADTATMPSQNIPTTQRQWFVQTAGSSFIPSEIEEFETGNLPVVWVLSQL